MDFLCDSVKYRIEVGSTDLFWTYLMYTKRKKRLPGYQFILEKAVESRSRWVFAHSPLLYDNACMFSVL